MLEKIEKSGGGAVLLEESLKLYTSWKE